MLVMLRSGREYQVVHHGDAGPELAQRAMETLNRRRSEDLLKLREMGWNDDLSCRLPSESSYLQAFHESAQPNAQAPPGWWVLPGVLLLIGLLLIRADWYVVGGILAAVGVFLLLGGSYRAGRNGRR